MSVSEKKTELTAGTAHRSPSRRPPRRPDMATMLTRVCGIALLIATIGMASCQALWVEAPGITLPIERQD